MPNQWTKGYTFVDGNVVDAAALNAVVDDAPHSVDLSRSRLWLRR